MERTRRVFAGIMLCGVILTAIAPVAQAQNTSAVGGSAGSSYSIPCASNELLVGLTIDWGLWIDRITPLCADASGAALSGGAWKNDHELSKVAGKTHLGNTHTPVECPAEYAIKSFSVRAGSYVHSLTLTCYKLGSSWRTTSTTKSFGPTGGSGGTSYPSKTCSDAMPAVGIHGKSGEYVDSFGLLCGYIMPVKPVLQAPINSIRAGSKRPTFYFIASGSLATGQTICINQTATADCAAPYTVKATLNGGTSSWTPYADLPFTVNTDVYWNVNACNDNGCKTSSVGRFKAY